MIQRKQSIYLVISLILWGLISKGPLIGFQDGVGGAWSLLDNGIKDLHSGKLVIEYIPLIIFFFAVELLLIISALLYTKRELQAKLVVVSIVLELLSYGLIAFYTFSAKSQLHAQPEFRLMIIMPLLSAIGSFLAYRGIRHDISLVKAQDRIR